MQAPITDAVPTAHVSSDAMDDGVPLEEVPYAAANLAIAPRR